MRVATACVLFLVFLTSPNATLRADELSAARRLFLTGKYEEAADAYAALPKQQGVEAAIGLARARQSLGDRAAAEKLLREARERHPQSAEVAAELALLLWQHGAAEEAQALVDATLVLDQGNIAARWLQAELHLAAGRIPAAEKVYAWLVDFHAQHDDIDSPDDLLLIARAAAQYARWNRRSQDFKLLVNEILPQALELDKNFWPAKLEIARLFAEKFNEAEAARALSDALAINGRAGELHAERAALALQNYDVKTAGAAVERALAINPELLSALQLKADRELLEGRLNDAQKTLEKARKLNPHDEETLGRLAAVLLVTAGPAAKEASSPAKQLMAEVEKRNPHCGRFYATLGDTFDLLRKYPQAAEYYAEAQRRLPKLIYLTGRLGLVKMRLGDEAEAAKLLNTSFRDDPFNIRVKNTLEVLDVLAGYAVLETEHFVIKFDRGQDELLAKYAAQYLEEEVFPEIVKTLGYEPQGKSLFEIFSRAKNTPGHGWFSARMVGMPFIGTVGACAGKVVALASPGDMPRKFHWGRVLKHEFVHVVNLQQTDFNIPHWFTEGLAVRSEDLPRSSEWERTLAERARAGTLFNLDTINFGFLRPANSDEWGLAYCQAELYCEYLVVTYGDNALAKLIRAYAENLTTEQALQREFQVALADFEKGYQAYVQQIVEKIGASAAADVERPALADLQRLTRERPKDAKNHADLALAALESGDVIAARQSAAVALELDRKQATAGYVQARLKLSIGEQKEARELLLDVHDDAQPDERVISLLAGFALQAQDYAEAERFFLLGQAKSGWDDRWLKALAKVYLKSGENDKLAAVLAKLAALDYDNIPMRKKLAQLAAANKDWEAAERWARDGLFIDINDADLHAQLAEARVNRQHYAGAIEEYRVAIQLNSKPLAWRLQLADALIEAGQRDEARQELQKLIEIEPDFPAAKLMLEQLKP